jgi:hypothetical protein
MGKGQILQVQRGENEGKFFQRNETLFQRRFADRHPIHDEVVSRRYRSRQTRLVNQLENGTTANQDQILTFRRLAKELKWGPRTQATYWGSLLSAKTLSHVQVTCEDKALQRLLVRRARKAQRWEPADPNATTTWLALQKALQQWRAPTTQARILLLGAAVVFAVGHRLTDFATIRISNIRFSSDDCSLLVVRGKTVNSQGPYTIHVPPQGQIAGMIQEMIVFARNRGFLYLLFPCHHLLDDEEDEESCRMLEALMDRLRQAMRLTLRSALKCPHWTVRALRRGGLSAMAQQGMHPDVTISFSRHTSTRQLDAYLGNGVLDGYTRRQQHAWVGSLPKLR